MEGLKIVNILCIMSLQCRKNLLGFLNKISKLIHESK